MGRQYGGEESFHREADHYTNKEVLFLIRCYLHRRKFRNVSTIVLYPIQLITATQNDPNNDELKERLEILEEALLLEPGDFL